MPADAVTLTLNTLDECHRGESQGLERSACMSSEDEGSRFSRTDATLCGPHVVDALASIIAELRNALSASLDRQDAQDVARLGRKSAMLVALAKEAIATYPYSEVPAHWRRLYMDASLLQVVADLRLVSLHSHAANVLPRLLDLVRTLDMANIVTGYFEDGRRQALDCLMAYTQEMLVECGKEQTQDGPEEPPVKRVRMTEVQECTDPSKARLLSNVRQIKRYASLDEAPEMFELSGCSEPFVVTDGVSHWPAIADPKTAWKDAAYLRAVAGRGRIVPVEIGSSYVAEGWTQKMLDFDTFLRDIRWQRDGKQDKTVSDGNPVVYLAQHDLFQQFPSLLSDIIPPDYVFAEPGPPEHFPDYCPPSTLSGYTLNAWMGPKGTYSPAHTDPYYNCYGELF